MSRTSVFLAIVLTAGSLPIAIATAQNTHPVPSPDVRAVPLQGLIQLDGRLNEAVWQMARPATDFRQFQPKEGEAATQRTEVRFAYDGEAMYVGARMFDDAGAAGVRTRLVRRDADPASDYIEVIFDTYHDHIGRLFFQVNPSGVKWDANGLGGGGDQSWDPVWEVQTAIDSLGWTAEMRIPFAQLRYPSSSEEQTWGLQIWRQENRLNELSQWAFWGKNEAGGPPRFGHLTGLVISRPPGRGEVLPYVVGRSANVPGDNSDPYFDPHALDGRIGADAVLRVTSNLTLNATVNPDFGQVEVDPAVVNLSAFETFFEEKRPFFVEGAGYFGLGGLNCYFCSNVSSLSMLSTRRIGRPPQVNPRGFAPVEFMDMPENSTILGAAKLTGRTRGGWSIGALNAVTRREHAPVQFDDGTRGTYTVEPLSNYFATRIAKDAREGATQWRAMATSVYRDLNERYLAERLSQHAEAFGIGTDMFWKKREYRLMAQFAATNVSGDTAAMRRIRFREQHFFNRPDRSDTAGARRPVTSMQGLGGYARFSRESGHIRFEASTNFRTPAFNNNDVTFFNRADYWWMAANIFPVWTKPTSWYREAYFIGGAQQQYNFDGDLNDRQIHSYFEFQTLSYWWLNTFVIWRPDLLDDRLARGGPVLKRPGITFWAANASTDRRKKIVANFGTDRGCNRDGDCDYSYYLTLELRPRSNVSLSFGPSRSHTESGFQFVDAYTDPTATGFDNRRVIFADLEQNEIAMNTRLNVTFSPTLTLELFVQPLISSGDFTNYKFFRAPRSSERLVYGRDVGTVIPSGGTIEVDADGAGGPAPAYTFDNPTFTFRSLRGNAVFRWEYRPGSTLFLVWTRSGNSSLSRGQIDFGTDAGALFQGASENVFLVKVNYWLGF
jgi:hypothetical protein